MCHIAYLIPGFDITEQEHRNARRINNDGSGFAYAKDGQLFVEKGFTSFEDFYEAYKKVGIDCPRVVHHRLGFGGGKTAENCHPFIINEGLCFAHNGMLTHHTAKGNQSDTNIFNEDVLKPLFGEDFTMIQKPYIKFLIGQAIGNHNKLVFLDKDGKASIINAQSGEWDKSKNGAWYSSLAHTYEPYNGATGFYKNGIWQGSSVTNSPVNSPAVKNNQNETYPQWIQRHYNEYVASQKKTQEKKRNALLLTQ